MTSIRIEIKGVLENHWNEWFDNMTFSYKGDHTILSGSVPDQSAFHGLLNTIRDLNLVLVSITSDIQNSSL